MATSKLSVFGTVGEAFRLAFGNFVPLFLLFLLFVLTIWIPYLNLATSIGFYKQIIHLSKGGEIDPLAIFDKENFAKIGDMAILAGLVLGGLMVGLLLFVIPFFVLAIAWGFSMYFLLDKGTSPLKSISLSFDLTRGEKWNIFAVEIVIGLLGCVAALFSLIPKIGIVLYVLVYLILCLVSWSSLAVMYRHFSAKADAALAQSATQPEEVAAE